MTNQKAGFWVRLVAHLVDWLILFVVFVIFELVASSRRYIRLELDPAVLLAGFLTVVFLASFYLILFFAYFTYFQGASGQTPGKMLFGLKVVALDGSPMGYGVSFVRALAYQASWASFGLGFLWAAFDREKQSWHDKIAATAVIKVEPVAKV